MATAKQVDLILVLWTKTGKLDRVWHEDQDRQRAQGRFPQTRAQFIARLRENLATASLDQMRTAIGKARAELGWQPETALASAAQRNFIADLEKRVYGRRRTLPQDALTFKEADAQIRYLKTLSAKAKASDDWASQLKGRS